MLNKIFFLFAFLVCCPCVQACQILDDLGHLLIFKSPAKRIISLAPDLTELLFEAGATDQVIGAMSGSDYPNRAQHIPVIGLAGQLNVEKIMALKPDLIVAWAEDAHAIHQLKNLSTPVYYSHQRRLIDIPHTLYRLSCLMGTEQKAAVRIKAFNAKYMDLQQKYQKVLKMTVFYELWHRPLLTVTQQSWINELMSLCGGQNIFASLPGTTAVVGLESILARDPQVILASLKQGEWEAPWQKWPNLRAVNQQNLYTVNPDWVLRATSRTLLAAEQICHNLDQARSKR